VFFAVSPRTIWRMASLVSNYDAPPQNRNLAYFDHYFGRPLHRTAQFLNRIRVQELNSLIANRLRGRDCVRTGRFCMQELVLTLVSGLRSLRPTV
jgi:hypothetical protein